MEFLNLIILESKKREISPIKFSNKPFGLIFVNIRKKQNHRVVKKLS